MLVAIGKSTATTLRYEWHALGNWSAAFDWIADLSPSLFQVIAHHSGMPALENLAHTSMATLAAIAKG